MERAGKFEVSGTGHSEAQEREDSEEGGVGWGYLRNSKLNLNETK